MRYLNYLLTTALVAALGCLVSHPGPERDAALANFHHDAAGAALVLNKWFAIQAGADHAGQVSCIHRRGDCGHV